MDRVSELSILNSGTHSSDEFCFDMMQGPNIYSLLTMDEITRISKLVNSRKLSGKLTEKIKMIDSIMKERNLFNRLGSGTNRLVYRIFNDQRYVIKIGIDSVGIEANNLEYLAQSKLKPFVAKTFYSDGVFAVSERVIPFKTLEQFEEVAGYVFDVMNNITGKYVIEDIGSNFFANWGVRENFGPVLLDYPYVYSISETSLYCTEKDPITEAPCCGLIDYDENYNYLVCTRCKKRHYAKQIASVENTNYKFIGGGLIPMRVKIVKDGKVICDSMKHADKIVEEPKEEKKVTTNVLRARIVKGDEELTHQTVVEPEPEVIILEEQPVEETVVVAVNEQEELQLEEEIPTVEENVQEEETVEDTVTEEDEQNPEDEYDEEPEVIIKQPVNTKAKIKSDQEKRCEEIDRNISKGIYYYNDDGDIVDKKGRKIKLPNNYYTRSEG